MGDRSTAPSSSELLNSREAADLLRVHIKHLYRLLRQGLPAHRIGGEWRFVRDELMGWGKRGPVIAPTSAPVLSAPPPLIAANGDLAIEALIAQVARSGAPPMGLVPADRQTALERLALKEVMAAGVHGPASPKQVAGRRMVRLDLVDREVGLAFKKSKLVRAIADIEPLRLASRPRSAGVRTHLDRALRRAGLDADSVHARATELASHRDVVLSIVRGEADVGLSSHAWASRVGLSFLPLTTERYGLLLFAEWLGHPAIVRLSELAQTGAYRSALSEYAGYLTRHTGTLHHLAAAGDSSQI